MRTSPCRRRIRDSGEEGFLAAVVADMMYPSLTIVGSYAWVAVEGGLPTKPEGCLASRKKRGYSKVVERGQAREVKNRHAIVVVGEPWDQ